MAKKHRHPPEDRDRASTESAAPGSDEPEEDNVDDETGENKSSANEEARDVAREEAETGETHETPGVNQQQLAQGDAPPPPDGSETPKETQVRLSHPPHGSALLDGGPGDYHPNEEHGATAGERLPTQSAPFLDEDTHDFGPNGGEEKCRECGKTRGELGLKIGRPLTVEELDHPDVKDGPLLPPRIR